MSRYVSRRAFLKLAGTGTAGAFLAACGAATAPTPAEAPAAAATTAPAPAAPTTAPAAPEAQKIVFSSYTWSGYEDSMNKVIAAWREENPGVEVEGQYVAEDYWTKLQTQVAAGTAPDVGISDYGRTVSYAKNGVLLPLDDLIAGDKYPMDQLLPAGVSQYRWRK